MAASTLSGNLAATLAWLNVQTTDLGEIDDSGKLPFTQNFSDGSGANEAHLLWQAKRTVASGANDDLDLTTLAAIAMFAASETVNFANIKAIQIVNLSTTSGDVLYLDGSVTNCYSFIGGAGNVQIGAGSTLVLSALTDGFGAIDGTHKKLRIRNASSGSHSITYGIAIIGQ